MKKVAILIILLISLVTIIFIFRNDKGEIHLKVESEDIVTVNINDKFMQPEATASYCKGSKCLDITSFITIDNDIDTTKIGNYTITYKLDYKNMSDSISIKVKVIDNIAPIITLKGNTSVSIALNETYKEKGYTATDNVDGDITDRVTITNNINNKKEGTYDITYSVKDSSGNVTSIKRTVKVYKAKTIVNFPIKSVDDLNTYLINSGYDVSVIYYNINNKYTYKYKENKTYYGASLIKTLDALYVYENMEVTDELKKLVKPTIEISNNETHKKLVDIIDRKNLIAYGKSIGAEPEFRENKYYYAYTNALTQLSFMKNLWRVINNNSKGEELKNYFINDYKNCLTFEGSPKIMHKYGETKPFFHDVGVVLDKSPYIIVILTNEGNNDYKKIIQNISKKVYEFHNATQK